MDIPHFKLYHDGGVHIQDPRVVEPVSFAQITDLHMHPAPEFWPEECRSAIEWWDVEFNRPSRVLTWLLDEIARVGVDFVLFTGDSMDHYSPEAAKQLVDGCHGRGFGAHFVLGNHDWQPANVRYSGAKSDEALRVEMGWKLCGHWDMPWLYYAFDFRGIRFVALDTRYERTARGYEGFLDSEQVDWLIEQLGFDGPIVAFHHVPFIRTNLRYPLRALWPGIVLWINENKQGLRARKALESCPNLLGTFTGHLHMSGESPLGSGCQFLTGEAGTLQWRYVRIDNGPHPKSLRQPNPPS